MENREITAKEISAVHIGTVASFEDVDGVMQRGEIRQISHDSLTTFVFLLDPEYDRNHNYAFPEFELDHDTKVTLEEEGE